MIVESEPQSSELHSMVVRLEGFSYWNELSWKHWARDESLKGCVLWHWRRAAVDLCKQHSLPHHVRECCVSCCQRSFHCGHFPPLTSGRKSPWYYTSSWKLRCTPEHPRDALQH